MNYRHAFHAGNHTEVVKHAVLVHLLRALREKEKPFFVLDTHSGAGLYDLAADEAQRTRESESGIERAQHSNAATLTPYLEIVRQFSSGPLRFYPGSPALIASLLRPGDRAVLCELHEDDFSSVRRFITGHVGMSALHRDGYAAMVALVPPLERRGLVFIDPPYERKNEVEILAGCLGAAFRKWSTGIFACWYPIKDKRIGRSVKEIAAEYLLPKSLAVEFLLHKPNDRDLSGSGMLIANAPWRFEILLQALCEDLVQVFGTQSSWSIDWIREPI